MIAERHTMTHPSQTLATFAASLSAAVQVSTPRSMDEGWINRTTPTRG